MPIFPSESQAVRYPCARFSCCRVFRMDDGGVASWSFYYDVATRTFFKFGHNGEG